MSWSAGGGTPAYAVTTHPNGTVTLALSEPSGISGANATLHHLGDRVVIVPVEPGCPSITSLRPPAVQPSSPIAVQTNVSIGGSITVNAKGIPARDILVVGAETITTATTRGGMMGGRLTSPPAPSCVSLLAPPANPGGSGRSHSSSSGSRTPHHLPSGSGDGSGPSLSSNG